MLTTWVLGAELIEYICSPTVVISVCSCATLLKVIYHSSIACYWIQVTAPSIHVLYILSKILADTYTFSSNRSLLKSFPSDKTVLGLPSARWRGKPPFGEPNHCKLSGTYCQTRSHPCSCHATKSAAAPHTTTLTQGSASRSLVVVVPRVLCPWEIGILILFLQ